MTNWILVILEIYICVILTVEYFYDKALNEHVRSMKKRTRKRYEFERLTTGEMK